MYERKIYFVERLFNTDIKGVKARIKNINNLLLGRKVNEWIKREVGNQQLATDSYSGVFTQNLGNYVFNGSNAGSVRTDNYPFYLSENHYWDKALQKSLSLTDNIESVSDTVALSDYYKSESQNTDEYIRKLFRWSDITSENIKQFIRLGLSDSHHSIYSSDNLELIYHLRQIQQAIECACPSTADLIFLKYFNGKRNNSEIAELMNVSHQSVSKRLKKISKKAKKWLQNQNESYSIK